MTGYQCDMHTPGSKQPLCGVGVMCAPHTKQKGGKGKEKINEYNVVLV